MKRITKGVQPEYFEAVKDGRKRFEVRLADFECKPGDILVLQEQKHDSDELTGREIETEILYNFNTKDIEKFYTKEEIDEHGLAVLAIRKDYKNN